MVYASIDDARVAQIGLSPPRANFRSHGVQSPPFLGGKAVELPQLAEV